jgi:hypothetical protein
MWLDLIVESLVICCTILIHVSGLLALSRATSLVNVERLGELPKIVLLTAVVFGFSLRLEWRYDSGSRSIGRTGDFAGAGRRAIILSRCWAEGGSGAF